MSLKLLDRLLGMKEYELCSKCNQTIKWAKHRNPLTGGCSSYIAMNLDNTIHECNGGT